MSTNNYESEAELIKQWQEKINTANHNNIFCHCQNCGYEWVDNYHQVKCKICGSLQIEKIPCWQFPDD